jgi:hypothetical protein
MYEIPLEVVYDLDKILSTHTLLNNWGVIARETYIMETQVNF